MITLLTGAKKNIGDYLITERSRQVVSKITGETDFLLIERWKPFDSRIDEVNSTKGIVICGGPAYARDFYPGILPLVKDLSKIKVPVVPIGLGLQSLRPDKAASFEFSKESLEAINYIHERCSLSGVRDSLTLDILKRSRVENAILTGCPVMYDFPSFGKPFSRNTDIRKIVFTPPAGKRLHRQSMRLAKLLRRSFPKAEITASFHRGLASDEHTPRGEALRSKLLAAVFRMYNIRSIDAAYDLARIAFYRESDLHVGYRVHAHVMFNSMRIPSFLLQEDNRGMGLSATLGLEKTDLPAADKSAPDNLMKIVESEVQSAFKGFDAVAGKIEKLYREMERVVSQLK
ncbi:MAG: hypothetical protein A2052_00440 [Deltaproteobacteria bacterium GWA2_54_12]|nr:MAG: hypothetical protein A2052_00440 [Deltaproteobacteria bacterium GWA2_54_12]